MSVLTPVQQKTVYTTNYAGQTFTIRADFQNVYRREGNKKVPNMVELETKRGVWTETTIKVADCLRRPGVAMRKVIAATGYPDKKIYNSDDECTTAVSLAIETMRMVI